MEKLPLSRDRVDGCYHVQRPPLVGLELISVSSEFVYPMTGSFTDGVSENIFLFRSLICVACFSFSVLVLNRLQTFELLLASVTLCIAVAIFFFFDCWVVVILLIAIITILVLPDLPPQ